MTHGVTLTLSAEHTPAELVACVDREIRLRERTYPHLVQLGKMSGAKAAEEVATMRAVLAVLRQVAAQVPPPAPRQGGLFGGSP